MPAQGRPAESLALIDYSAHHAAMVRGWIDTADTLTALGESQPFPPSETLPDDWQSEGIISRLLLTEHGIVAYAELRHMPTLMALEVHRLLVSPVFRGRGYGAAMLRKLVGQAGEQAGIATVRATVPISDPAAAGCFLKAGFQMVGTLPQGEGIMLEYVLASR